MDLDVNDGDPAKKGDGSDKEEDDDNMLQVRFRCKYPIGLVFWCRSSILLI